MKTKMVLTICNLYYTKKCTRHIHAAMYPIAGHRRETRGYLGSKRSRLAYLLALFKYCSLAAF